MHPIQVILKRISKHACFLKYQLHVPYEKADDFVDFVDAPSVLDRHVDQQ